MLLTADFFDPRTITGYARQALRDWADNQPSLARYLPWKPLDDLDFRFDATQGGLTSIAPFRTFDTEASITGRKGISRIGGTLPPISRKIILGEYDRLRKRANPTQAIEDAILSDVDILVSQIAMAFEVERGDALVNASVTPPGLAETIPFTRAGGNSVTANVLWSSAFYGTSDPINDLLTWARYYRRTNGVPPGVILMSEDRLIDLLNSVAVRGLAGNILGTPTVLDQATLATILTRNGLPPIEIYEVQYDSTGNNTPARVIPNNVVLLLPAPVDPNSPEATKLGATFLGTPSEADDPRYNVVDSPAGIIAGNYTQDDPPGIWTKASTIGIAGLGNGNLSMKAVVA
jgi:hypothetical protein